MLYAGKYAKYPVCLWKLTSHDTDNFLGVEGNVEGVSCRKTSTDERSKLTEEWVAKAAAQDSGLSEDEIERMVKEAQRFKEEDSRQRKTIEGKPGRRTSAGKLHKELKFLYWEHY